MEARFFSRGVRSASAGWATGTDRAGSVWVQVDVSILLVDPEYADDARQAAATEAAWHGEPILVGPPDLVYAQGLDTCLKFPIRTKTRA
jgi:hypothetical protein